jgi:hypothetical protein
MAVQRANPLPPGFYWVAVPPDGHSVEKMTVTPFNAWLREHSATVRTHKTEELATGHTWYLFRVLEPTEWKGPGYPEKAPQEHETTVNVVADAPEVHYPLEDFTTWISSAEGPGALVRKAATGAAIVGSLALLIFLGAKGRS